ncbi:hypothetical protein [Actinomadura hibisca]|uniref:hypothetical protein n=1 Tax=Actinomadura hibisca TaxID=68565 RepID=UPI00082AF4A9|nr:hypothetical protein [Actinomadura hibisca]
MEVVLLSIHVLASIVFIGGSAVATSLFPRYAPIAESESVEPSLVGASGAGAGAGDTAASGTGEIAANGTGVATASEAGERSRSVAVALHRITRGYALAGLIVPLAGIVLATVQGRMGEVWITVSMVLTGIAGILLALQIYPRQSAALSQPGGERELRTLSMLAGFYNLLWAIVVVLMISRPGG